MPRFYSKGHGKKRRIIPLTARSGKRGRMSVASNIRVSERQIEKNAVKEETEDHEKYLKMAEVAEKQGRPEDAEVYRNHAEDEQRHGEEDAEIVKRTSKPKASQSYAEHLIKQFQKKLSTPIEEQV